jgi:hypothetical protein
MEDETIILIEFSKIIKDLLNDLNTTFSDKISTTIINNYSYNYIIDNDYDNNNYEKKYNIEHIKFIYNHCKLVFPERFFDIIYQNEDIFSDTNINTEFLPNIYFSELYYDTTSIQTKETLWKYLQLILFTIVPNIDQKESFGNSAQLFEAINKDEFKAKLEETVKNLGSIFNFKDSSGGFPEMPDLNDISGIPFNFDKMASDISNMSFNFDEMASDISNMPFNFNEMFKEMNKNNDQSNNDQYNNDQSNNNFKSMPNIEGIHDHINKLINGKIGSLAKELAEETSKDLDLDGENINDVNDVFKKLFKNPTKLMNLVNNISSKIDTKMKDGSIKESELLEEASSIFKNMKSMPGMDNFDSLFKSMNLDQFIPKGGKFNNNAFENMMNQNIKMSKMKERMKKKAEANKTQYTQYTQNYSETNNSNNINPNANNLNDINSNLAGLMEQMKNLQSQNDLDNTFINDILKKQNQETSNSSENKKTNNKKPNKKKANRKK